MCSRSKFRLTCSPKDMTVYRYSIRLTKAIQVQEPSNRKTRQWQRRSSEFYYWSGKGEFRFVIKTLLPTVVFKVCSEEPRPKSTTSLRYNLKIQLKSESKSYSTNEVRPKFSESLRELRYLKKEPRLGSTIELLSSLTYNFKNWEDTKHDIWITSYTNLTSNEF